VSQPLLKCGLELLKHGVKHAPALEAHKAAMLDCLATISQKKRRDASTVPREDAIVIN
jgi:hypothetical protein